MHASSERPQVIVVFDEEETDPTYCQQSRGNDGNLAGETAPLAIPDRQLVAAIAETVKCTDLVIRAETAVVSSHHNHRPLLDPRIAAIVSSVSTACRISLRTASIVVEAVFESLKFSASTSLAITRRALVAAVSSARTLHLIAMGKGKSISFFNVLDRYTSAGVYVIHNVFSLAELLTHTTFHLASSTIRFSLNAAEECVQVLDGLFGETETSKALAAFICLVKKELSGHEDDLALSNKVGRISALGQVTKALTAYCCLQYVNRNRWRNSLKLTAIFEGHVRMADIPEDTAAKAYAHQSAAMQIDHPSDLAEMALAEMHSLAAGQPDRDPAPPPSLNRTRFLGAMDRRRMSNPERFSALTLRACDFEAARPMTREDSGIGPDLLESHIQPLLHDTRDRHHRDGRHGSLTPDGRRQRTQSGQSSPYKLDHAQVSSVLRMLESVQMTGRVAPAKTKRPSKWDKNVPVSRPNREMTQSRQHNRSSFSGRYKELPALPRLEPAKPPRQQLFEKISRYVRFASGAYGTNFLKILGIGKAREFLIEHSAEHDHNHQSFAFHTDVPVEHILTSSFRNPNALHPPSLIAPVHYLVVDAKTEAVVVSLRGTLGLSDLITDLTSSYSSFTTSDGHVGKVHAGMLESAEKVARGPVRDAVMEALKKHPTFSLVLTGHSLGGGVAALLALIWSRKTVDENGDTAFHTCPNNGFPIRPVQCFIYGPPAVMSLDLSHHYKSLITTVVYRHDIVPCLSLGLIRDFRNVAVNICNEQGMAERVIGKVLGVFKSYPTGSSVPSDDPSSTSPQSIEDDLWYWALLKTLRADMRAEKLYPPGSVYWIDATTPAIVASTPTAASASTSDSGSNSTPPPTTPTSDSAKPSRIATALTVHHVDDVEKAFSEFTFSRTMFLDHSPYSYERALHALMVAMKTQQWV
ncbi:hypothetical protein PhCBS80983_g00557 [Powellomyces hirtus]|uniref:sn-1-specific diacylglycerol lipase n=1 Tax=Powellomyces hirtus TaxID=109895 RepID=A0A507EEN1_9FUNG|nr:hypothetical protein PhCBS80983_g00557 [Powellomyces hirtus]